MVYNEFFNGICDKFLEKNCTHGANKFLSWHIAFVILFDIFQVIYFKIQYIVHYDVMNIIFASLQAEYLRKKGRLMEFCTKDVNNLLYFTLFLH